MPRRRDLRGVAHGLLSSFLSRNNDVGGYWALGRLYKHSVYSGDKRVCVDLLDGAITPYSVEFEAMLTHYQRALADQLAARRLPAVWVKTAKISVGFSREKSRHMPGDSFVATVAIVDDLGRERGASADGACWVHNPSREAKSTRAT